MNLSSPLPRRPVGSQNQFPQPITPYGGAYYPDPDTYSSHYAQAYFTQTTPQSAPPRFNFSSPATDGTNKTKGTPVHLMSTWYHPGNIKCSYPGCVFQGSHKSVELHRMDRHLIYPPDWDKKKKKKSEWDADPSLKGKPTPIQGTSVILNTPELIGAWIAERKKRFPTSTRLEEREKKMAEAMERGQLDLDPSRSARPPKRWKVTSEGQRPQMHGNRGATMPRNARIKRKQRVNVAHITRSPEKGDKKSDDDEAAPEELSSKIPDLDDGDETIATTPSTFHQPQKQQRRLKELQPRAPPKNPFGSRPLLRNLLLPEIRMTVSNLSQAIRFLIDNDLLCNVELKPGQSAEQQKIHVLNSQESSIT